MGLGDAVVIGLGSMVGAGVYSVWTAASRSAGDLLLVGLAIAAAVAAINAFSSARLAVLHPRSGGTYVYGRERLGPTWGFLAGWGFVVGKTASCAAMASTIGVYVLPEHSRAIATAAIIGITTLNIGGLHRTVAVTRVLLVIAAVVLSVVIIAGWTRPEFDLGAAVPWGGDDDSRSTARSIYDTLQAAGLLFFAFAGYARIATLGEEVRDPERTIPRAILISLTAVLTLYAVIGLTILGALTPAALAQSVDPLRSVVEVGSSSSMAPIVGLGATLAALGALLNLLPGVSRTILAMARNGDLPKFFAHVDTRRTLPVRAEIAVSTLAVTIVVLFDLTSSIALSGVGVLVYYAIANASALTIPSRRSQRIATIVGLIGCLSLVACLPRRIALTGSIVLVVGFMVHAMRAFRRRRHDI